MMSSPIGMVMGFIVTIAILVAIHEYGHFWVARRLGIKVLRFSVGFGKPLFRWYGKDGVEYVIARIPLGGYVKMLDERMADVHESEKHLAFNTQPVSKRIAVVVAGPLANFLLAIAVYWLMFVLGIPGIKPIVGEVFPDSVAERAGLQENHEILAVDGARTPTWEAVNLALINRLGDESNMRWRVTPVGSGDQNAFTIELPTPAYSEDVNPNRFLEAIGMARFYPSVPPVIGDVYSGGAASEAGLRRGDEVVSTNQQPITGWQDWVTLIRDSADKPLQIAVRRDGQLINLTLTPKAKDEEGRVIGFIGARAAAANWPEYAKIVESYSPLQSVSRAVEKTYSVSILTLELLYKMVTGNISPKNLGGPISIAQGAGRSLDAGVAQFLSFLGLVSISLGILNLLPVPVLDGGHLLFYLIEAMTGKNVPDRVQLAAMRLGVIFLVAISLLAFYNDVARL